MGIECFRVQFPKNMDANEYALKVQPALKSLEIMLNQRRMAGQRRAAHRGGDRTSQDRTNKDRAGEDRTAHQSHAAERSADSPTKRETPAVRILKKNQKKKPNPQLKKKMRPAPVSPFAPRIEEPEKVFPLAAQPQSESGEESAPIPPTPAAPSREWQVLDVPVEIKGDEIIHP